MVTLKWLKDIELNLAKSHGASMTLINGPRATVLVNTRRPFKLV